MVGQISQALSKAQTEFPEIKKNKTAEIQFATGKKSYHYADLSEILHAVLPVLGKNKLSIIQPINTVETKTFVITRLMHESGEYIESQVELKQDKPGIQAFGAAVSYIRRYALCSMLSISPEDDLDGQAESKAPWQPKLNAQNGPINEKSQVPSPTPRKLTEPQIKRLFAILKGSMWEEQDLKKYMKKAYNLEHTHDLTKQQYDATCEMLQTKAPEEIGLMNDGHQEPS